MSLEARIVVEAFDFAAHAHARQKRDDMGDSYLVHLAEVAHILAGIEPFDAVLVAAGLLHDTVEDTDATIEKIADAFGDEIAGIVAEVTDPPGLPAKEKQPRQAEQMKIASSRARLLKLADKTSNVAELADVPKSRRPRLGQMKRYLKGARAVVASCRGLDANLEAGFDQTAARLDARIAKLEKKGKKK